LTEYGSLLLSLATVSSNPKSRWVCTHRIWPATLRASFVSGLQYPHMVSTMSFMFHFKTLLRLHNLISCHTLEKTLVLMPNVLRGASTLPPLITPGANCLHHMRVHFTRPPSLPALLPRSCAPRSWTSETLTILVLQSFAQASTNGITAVL